MKSVKAKAISGALEYGACMKLVSDLDHLNEKSNTVTWVDVSIPHKRHRRLKDNKVLEDMAKGQPDSVDIFEDNLIDTYYPQRPQTLEDLCLYDFVANYNCYGMDKDGRRKYTKPTAHKALSPQAQTLWSLQRRSERRLLQLSGTAVPFKDESSLFSTMKRPFNEPVALALHTTPDYRQCCKQQQMWKRSIRPEQLMYLPSTGFSSYPLSTKAKQQPTGHFPNSPSKSCKSMSICSS